MFQGRTEEGADVAIKQLHYEDVSAREREREREREASVGAGK